MLRNGRCVLFALFFAARVRGTPWPVVDSDLPSDPAVRWGTLSNGLRYAVRPNAEPKGRISIRLLVAVGSLNERDDERGLAHFVEHMVYRGTRDHPGGTLISALQRLGVGFGPDNTAFTSWDHTIYQLELPDNRETTLREGLGFFREYAEDVTFAPGLIERERDVVLNEYDTRNTPDTRSGETNLAFLWPDSLQARRAPIGLPALIRAFTREQFVAFYDAWYRPDRMAVIVVGDIDPELSVRLVAEVFRSLQPRAPPRPDVLPAIPGAASGSNIHVFTDPDLAGASCNLEHPFPEPGSPDTHQRRVFRLRRALAFAMLQRRAAKFARRSDGQLVSPVANVTTPLPGWALAAFGAAGKINDWQGFMADLEQEHRRAFLHGFSAAELNVVRAAFATYYDNTVSTAATWPSSWIAGLIASSMVSGEVFTTPATVRQDLAGALATVTPAECLDAFRRTWSRHAPHVFVSTNPVFRVTATEIAAALNRSRATAVAPPPDSKAAAFAYGNFGPPGRIVREEHAGDLDITQAAFGNGVLVNFKPTPFEADTVEVYVRVGNGRLGEPADRPGLDLLANVVVPQGGLGRHPVEDLQDILSSHTLAVSFAVDNDAFDFNARCSRRDLPLCLQVIAAQLTDTAYRDDAMPQARAQFGSMFASLASSPGGTIALQALRVLAGGDLRFGLPLPAELEQRTIPEVRAWVDPQFKHGPIEAGIVGDTTWGEVSAAVAATLGALPDRQPRSAVVTSQPLSLAGQPRQHVYVSTTEPTLHQIALAWIRPVPDLDGARMERRCRLLADLLGERLRVRLREELGAAYGCDADFTQTDGFPDLSFFSVYTAVASDHAERADHLIRDEIEKFGKEHFTDDEFERVKLPFLAARDADLRNNSYWGYTVLRDAQQRPERLAAARDRTADCNAIRRSDLEALAQRYFQPDRWIQFVAHPAGGASQRGLRAGAN